MYSNTLKKLCCIALTAALAVSVCGCKNEVDPELAKALQAAQAAQQAAENGETPEDAEAASELEALLERLGIEAIDGEDELWTDVEYELPAVAQILAYKATFPETFDENDPSADDFWTVTAMGVTAVHPEDAADPFNIVHMKEAAVLDYAAALIPGYDGAEAAPKLEDVYGISGDPRSDLIDIDALSIGLKSEIVMLGRTQDGTLVARIRIEDEGGLITENEWDCTLSAWDDEQEHALPFILEGFVPAL